MTTLLQDLRYGLRLPAQAWYRSPEYALALEVRTAPPLEVKNVLQTERESRYTLSLKGRLSWDFNYV